VNVLALECLLLPAGVLALSDGAVPCDLLAAGQTVAPMAIVPAFITLSGGVQQSLTALQNGLPYTNVLWEISPAGFGSIDGGVYTAPAEVSQAVAVTVRAIDQANSTQVGYCLVLVVPAAGSGSLELSPQGVVVTEGQSYTLSVTSNGSPVEAAITLDPNIGTVESWMTGQYSYTAPSSIADWQTVTVSANLGGQSASVDIQLAPLEVVTVSATPDNVGPGQTVSLTAVVANDFVEDVAWALYPPGSGSVEWKGVLQAAYTAPASIGSVATVKIVAYGIGDGAGVGAGSASVNLVPSVAEKARDRIGAVPA
jgi:hypothetical protein